MYHSPVSLFYQHAWNVLVWQYGVAARCQFWNILRNHHDTTWFSRLMDGILPLNWFLQFSPPPALSCFSKLYSSCKFIAISQKGSETNSEIVLAKKSSRQSTQSHLETYLFGKTKKKQSFHRQIGAAIAASQPNTSIHQRCPLVASFFSQNEIFSLVGFQPL